MLPHAFGIHNEQNGWDGYNMRVIIVSTETTQGFTVGLTTQRSSGGVWETQPFDITFDTLEIMVSRIVLYAGRNP